MKRFSILSLLAISACASTLPANDALDKARVALRAAQADLQVAQYAPAELDLATEALRDAERSTEDQAHRGYVAQQRARIARELAAARAFDAQRQRSQRLALEERIKDAENERDRALARAVAAERSRDDQDRLAAEVRRLKAQVAQLEAEKTERGWILTLGSDLLFDLGQARLKPSGQQAIANVARFMRERGERKIVIEGFTDNTGSPAFNQRLSDSRAKAVRDALVKQGIDGERIEARGLGPANPVASNDNPSGRSLNRRVEIVIGEGVGRAATGASRSAR
jgi:outer membrane protein OmpA-like peptidoglycan-associated protein